MVLLKYMVYGDTEVPWELSFNQSWTEVSTTLWHGVRYALWTFSNYL